MDSDGMHGASPRPLTTHEIIQALDDAPFEAGVTHPFTTRLEQELRASGPALAVRAAQAIALRPDLQVDIVRSLGRLPAHLAFDALNRLMVEGLRSTSLRVRGAAVRALEEWNLPESRAMLRDHDEPVPWLRDYIRRVTG